MFRGVEPIVQERENVWLRRLKNPLRLLASESVEHVEYLREDPACVEVQLPAPPRPTWQIAPSLIFCSRVRCRSNSSSKEKAFFSALRWMLPAPPLPLLNLMLVSGRPASKRDAGACVVRPVLDLGALKVLPAPPRPEWM